jgi:hypothetical protein
MLIEARTVTCTFGRKNQEVDPAVFAASFGGTLAACLWAIGLGILTDGLYKISTTLRNSVWWYGLLGANVGLAYLLTRPPLEYWVSYCSWTLCSMYIGMACGLLFERKTFLLEDEKVALKD